MDVSDKLLGLPLPIIGPDGFEPDNTPKLAVWSGLQRLVTGLVGALLPTPDMHNLHVAEDEDWSKFEAVQGDDVKVETVNVGPLADTQLIVYRLLTQGEPLPTKIPPGCKTAWTTGPDGELLAVIGCNDDTGEAGPQGIRSMLKFIAPKSGLYYSRVTLADKARLVKALQPKSGETTYGYAASSYSTMSSTLYCTLADSATGKGITTGTVTLAANGAKVTKNSNGVYTISGLKSGSYSIKATATGYTGVSATVNVSGTSASATLKMAVATKTETSAVSRETAASFDFAAPYGQISLEEMLRLMQLYNAREIHCDAASEDGFAPGHGDLQCAPHVLDANMQDWTIDLSELLRAVQFFSAGGYQHCSDGPDGLCTATN